MAERGCPGVITACYRTWLAVVGEKELGGQVQGFIYGLTMALLEPDAAQHLYRVMVADLDARLPVLKAQTGITLDAIPDEMFRKKAGRIAFLWTEFARDHGEPGVVVHNEPDSETRRLWDQAGRIMETTKDNVRIVLTAKQLRWLMDDGQWPDNADLIWVLE